jgi:restriction system protein
MSRGSGFVAAQMRAQREAERRQKAYARAQKEEQRERERARVRSRADEVALKNQELADRVTELQRLLSRSLEVDDFIELDTLKQELAVPTFDPQGRDRPELPPVLETYLPSKPSFLVRLWPGITKKHEHEVAAARERFEAAWGAHSAREAQRIQALQEARAQYHARVFAAERDHEAQHAAVEDLKGRFAAGDPAAVAEYFLYVLEASSYPEDFPRHARVAYVPESKQLVVELDLPKFEVVPVTDSYKYVKVRDEITATLRAIAHRKSLYGSVIAQMTLRTLHELVEADRTGQLDSVVINGYVDAIDSGTGADVRPCLVTVRTTRDAFTPIHLGKVDPATYLKALNAGVSRSPAELAPVRPVLEFNMVDPRFVEESDVLSTLDQRPNLMELTPNEFESLITNLFEKMGLQTRLTQASRDGGVDCVAYDPRPIFGGKVVIQAKRYKHTVGVSAVRDLFGTVQNEGASKGILVSTSGYGKASYDFAGGKPLELLAGSNLLYLLKEHAGIDAKIEVPDTWRDPVPDAPEEYVDAVAHDGA